MQNFFKAAADVLAPQTTWEKFSSQAEVPEKHLGRQFIDDLVRFCHMPEYEAHLSHLRGVTKNFTSVLARYEPDNGVTVMVKTPLRDTVVWQYFADGREPTCSRDFSDVMERENGSISNMIARSLLRLAGSTEQKTVLDAMLEVYKVGRAASEPPLSNTPR